MVKFIACGYTFLPFVKDGVPIICICITTKFSSSMQSALNARTMIQEEYLKAEITVIDATVNVDRGRKRSERKVLNLLLDHLQKSSLGIECYSLAVGYGYDRNEGIALRNQALSVLQDKGYEIDKLPVYQIGATIWITGVCTTILSVPPICTMWIVSRKLRRISKLHLQNAGR